MIPESVKALAARLIRFAELNEDTGRVAVGQADAMREAASRLTCQEDETRRAALEEAEELNRCLQWFLRCEYEGNGLMDCVDNAGKLNQSEDMAKAIKAAEEAIDGFRALKEAGHG